MQIWMERDVLMGSPGTAFGDVDSTVLRVRSAGGTERARERRGSVRAGGGE